MSIRAGTPQHRDLFCRAFVETHLPFEPEALPWPQLEPHHVELLRGFPFWSLALGVEQKAGRMLAIFAESLGDPAIRKAVALQGYEEARHGRLLAHMLSRYGIEVQVAPPSLDAVARDDFLVFGFSECTDSFIGFGGFALARQKQLFPKQLLDVFSQVLYEEARHIVFFINWWRYEEALAGHGNAFARTARAIRYHVRAIQRTAQGAQDTANLAELTSGGSQAIFEGVTPQTFLEVALAEHRAMMERFDVRLLKPQIVPALATAAVLGLRMLPPRKSPEPRVRLVA
jgi:hypothetical protein